MAVNKEEGFRQAMRKAFQEPVMPTLVEGSLERLNVFHIRPVLDLCRALDVDYINHPRYVSLRSLDGLSIPNVRVRSALRRYCRDLAGVTISRAKKKEVVEEVVPKTAYETWRAKFKKD